MKPNSLFAMLLLPPLLLAGTGGTADTGGTAGAALRDLDGFTVEAVVDGVEVSTLVTASDIEKEMTAVLTQSGIWNDAIDDPDFRVGRLRLVFKSYSIEPVLPEAHTEPVHVFPISVYLMASRPLYLHGDGGATEVEAQVWWTHVEAWALQRTMHSVACMAVRRALGQFLDAHAAAQPAGGPPDTPVPGAHGRPG